MAQPTAPQVTPERLMQFAWGFSPPLIIETGIRTGVFDALDSGPKSLDEVVAATGASTRGLRAIMNALVGLQFLAKESGDRYRLTPESAAFLVSSKPSFQGGMFKHISTQLLPNFCHLPEIARSGGPVKAVNQQGPGAEFFEQFVADLFPTNYPAAQALATALGVAESKRPVQVLDLATGSGVWGIALAQNSPYVRVRAVDWPSVLEVTRRIAGKFGVQERFEFVPGDLDSADFGTGNNIATLGHILHSEGPERSRVLLKKVFAALAPGGTIAIAEFLVADDRSGSPMGLLFAVNMLVHTDQGDTFSFEEISAWLAEAGFTDMRTLEAPGPSPLILATKPK